MRSYAAPPSRSASRLRSRWSVAAPRWRLAAPLVATLAASLSCGGDTAAPAPPPPPPPQPTTVSVAPSVVRLTVGDSVQLTAEVRDQTGQVMTGVAVAWASSATGAVTVTSAGLVHGINSGLATVTATAGRATGNAEVAVSRTASHPDRAALVALYDATGGTSWRNSINWLTDEPLGQWRGVTANHDGSVGRLVLPSNGLAGNLPPELGNLANLRILELHDNQLAGPIPIELGSLANLEYLSLYGNRLAGPIPVELGNIANLATLLAKDNRLTGAIPAELGSQGNLVELELSDNSLDGPVPAEFGNLSKLQRFNLTNNPEMAGTLPASLTSLGMLAEFFAGGTGLCAPPDTAFLRWLDGIRQRRVRLCESGGGSAAYLTQAVQSRAFPVPLVAGEPALLRVFVSASGATGEGMPPVRARFYRNGSEVHVANIAASSAPIPTSLNEGDLGVSANASIPEFVVQPGLEMVVEIDPDGTLDASLGIAGRIPAEGRAPVPVRATPELDFTIVPFLWREAPDSAVVRLTAGLTADNDALLGLINTILPVGDIDLNVHEAVVTESNDAIALLQEIAALRNLEGAAGDGYYQGIMSGTVTGATGIAGTPGRASFARPNPEVMAHELGHNFSLMHAPCGEPDDLDPNFPVPDGSIGAWGFDVRGDSLVAPDTPDLMSYCMPRWVSDYHFTKAHAYRVYEEAASGAAVAAGPERALLLWGGVGEGGEPFLEPAFVVDAPPSLPVSPGGEYTVAGHDAGGRELFSISFDMPVLSHGDGRSAFAFTLPARQEWAGALAAITLSGPGGSFTLDESSDRAAAIVRDPLTGQVRGIFRDAPLSLMAAAGMAAPLGPEAAAALSLEPNLEVLASRGIPRPEDWRR